MRSSMRSILPSSLVGILMLRMVGMSRMCACTTNTTRDKDRAKIRVKLKLKLKAKQRQVERATAPLGEGRERLGMGILGNTDNSNLQRRVHLKATNSRPHHLPRMMRHHLLRLVVPRRLLRRMDKLGVGGMVLYRRRLGCRNNHTQDLERKRGSNRIISLTVVRCPRPQKN